MISTQDSQKRWKNAVKLLRGTAGLSIVMPVYNLAPMLVKNLQRVRQLCAGNIPFEIIPVDDGSDDESAKLLTTLADETIRPVLLSVNGGKGAALRAGLAAAHGDFVLLLDGDLDLDPELLPGFFDTMVERHVDIVIGSKRHPRSEIHYPLIRRLVSSLYYTGVRLLTGLRVSDTQTGMKLFRRAALTYAFDRMLVKAFAFDVEVLTIATMGGYTLAEAPIRLDFHDARLGCFTPSTVWQVMKDTLAIFYRTRILHYYQHAIPLPATPNSQRSYSVVIACPAPSPYLTECLTGLAAQTWSYYEVIVLPDAEPPADFFEQPCVKALQLKGCLRIIPTGKVRPAEKRNAGAAVATGEIIALIDDDASPYPDWLERATPYFDIADIGALGGPGITPPSDSLLQQCSGEVFANRFVSGAYRYRYTGERQLQRIDLEDYPSCNLLIRSDLYQTIGGFRTDFWPGEDTILCADIIAQGQKIAYDPRLIVTHHRRALFLPHLRQVGRYALHRGYFAKHFRSTSLRLSYMLPSLFVLGLIVGAPMSYLWWPACIFYVAVVAFYLVVTCLSCASLHPICWVLTWLGVIATHLVYGVRFLQGLLSRRMPCQVQIFDHPAEKSAESPVTH